MAARKNVYFIIVICIGCIITNVYADDLPDIITSPNYPNNYPSGSVKKWSLAAPSSGYRIRLDVSLMDLHAGDTVEIFDGWFCTHLPGISSRLKTYKGTHSSLPDVILSSGKDMCIKMTRPNGGRGFKMSTSAFPECTGTYHEQRGDIMSPGYPYKEYWRNKDCKWTVNIPEGQKLEFELLEMDINPENNCGKDSLTLREIENYPNGVAKLCGKQSTSMTMMSKQISATVSFQTGWYWFSSDHQGFWLMYKALGCRKDKIPIQKERLIINPANYYSYDYILKTQCQDGWRFPKNEIEQVITCSEEKKGWDGTLDDCIEITCGDPGTSHLGNYSLSNGHKIGSVATYYCTKGTIFGGITRTCTINGTWTGEIPHCKDPEEKKCGNLADPLHGQKFGDQNSVGANVTFVCDIGFNLIGSAIRFCQSNGTWSGQAVKCQRVTCPRKHSFFDNGKIFYDGNEYGNIAKYTCNDGFYLTSGNEVSICSANGTWSGVEPICERIECPDPVKYPNSAISFGDKGLGAVVKYICDKGFVLYGNENRTCLADETWSGEPPLCIAVRCEDIRNITNGKLQIEGNRLGDKAVISCNSGFWIAENQSLSTIEIKCQENGNWTVNVTGCIPKSSVSTKIPIQPTDSSTAQNTVVTGHRTSTTSTEIKTIGKLTTFPNWIANVTHKNPLDPQARTGAKGDSTPIIVGSILGAIVLLSVIAFFVNYFRSRHTKLRGGAAFENPIYVTSEPVQIQNDGAVSYRSSVPEMSPELGDGTINFIENDVYATTVSNSQQPTSISLGNPSNADTDA